MKTPTVSIIMSTFNDALYIKRAITSVLQQTYTDWEFIIINDDSKDTTEKIVTQFAKIDSRIKLFTNATNKGLVKNLIAGVEKSKGKYIARIDGDDEWIDMNKLKKQIEFLEKNPDYGLIGTWANIIDTQGNLILQTKNPSTDSEIRNYLLIENCFFHSSVVIRKSILKKVGGYNPYYFTTEDYNLWLRIGVISKMYNMPEYLINYRINPNGINSTKYHFQLDETIKLVKDFRHEYPNYAMGIVLWRLRKYVPQKVKTVASTILKNNIVIDILRQIKKALLTLSLSY